MLGGKRISAQGKPSTINRLLEDLPTCGSRGSQHEIGLNSQGPHW